MNPLELGDELSRFRLLSSNDSGLRSIQSGLRIPKKSSLVDCAFGQGRDISAHDHEQGRRGLVSHKLDEPIHETSRRDEAYRTVRNERRRMPLTRSPTTTCMSSRPRPRMQHATARLHEEEDAHAEHERPCRSPRQAVLPCHSTHGPARRSASASRIRYSSTLRWSAECVIVSHRHGLYA